MIKYIFCKTVCFVTASNILNSFFNVVFIFYSFLILIVFKLLVRCRLHILQFSNYHCIQNIDLMSSSHSTVFWFKISKPGTKDRELFPTSVTNSSTFFYFSSSPSCPCRLYSCSSYSILSSSNLHFTINPVSVQCRVLNVKFLLEFSFHEILNIFFIPFFY